MEVSLPNLLAVLTAVLPVADSSQLDKISLAWEEREQHSSTVEIEYRSHLQIGAERRDNRQVIALFAPDGRMYCKAESIAKGRLNGTYTTEELVLSEIGISSIVVNTGDEPKTTARLTDRQVAITSFGELSTTLQLMRPSEIGPLTNYNLQPKSQINGRDCQVLQRTDEMDGTAITVTLFLLEESNFLPVRRVVSARRNGKVDMQTELEVSYDQIDNVYVPKVWVLRETINPDGPNSSIRKTTAVRTRFEMDVDISDERFMIELPEGTRLRDLRGDAKLEEVLTESHVFKSQD